MRAPMRAKCAQRPNAFRLGLCKATSRDGNGAPAEILHGRRRSKLREGTSRAIPVRGAISEMGVRRQWPTQERPSHEAGAGRFVPRSPDFRIPQISGRPARNRVVFISRRRLERVICPSRETDTGNAKHKARSAKSGSQARTPSFAHSPPKLMKTAQILASLPLENVLLFIFIPN